MKSSENFEYEQATNNLKYPKPKCKVGGCGNETRHFNDGFCYGHTPKVLPISKETRTECNCNRPWFPEWKHHNEEGSICHPFPRTDVYCRICFDKKEKMLAESVPKKESREENCDHSFVCTVKNIFTCEKCGQKTSEPYSEYRNTPPSNTLKEEKWIQECPRCGGREWTIPEYICDKCKWQDPNCKSSPTQNSIGEDDWENKFIEDVEDLLDNDGHSNRLPSQMLFKDYTMIAEHILPIVRNLISQAQQEIILRAVEEIEKLKEEAWQSTLSEIEDVGSYAQALVKAITILKSLSKKH